MTMSSERSSSSRPLHNFNLPGLRWGFQRHLGCVTPTISGGRENGYHGGGFDLIGKRKQRENYGDDDEHSPADFRRRSDCRKSGLSSSSKSGFPARIMTKTTTECSRKVRRPPEIGHDGDGIAAVREKLMTDLQAETDRIKDAIFREGLDSEVAPPSSSAAEPETRPWNLRTRRAAAPTSNGIGGSSPAKAPIAESTKPKPNSSLLQPRLRSRSPENEKNERPEFSVALSRKEIDDDILAITGRKPHRRPRKRPRHVQKTLDTLFPGLWLTEINADMYKVPRTR